MPESLKVSPPLTARWLGAAVEAKQSDDMVETTRDVEVTLPASTNVGARQEQLNVGWAGEKTLEHRLAWQVHPCIRAFPSGLVLAPSAERETRTVLLQCDDRPFRITKVAGAMLADGDESPSLSRKVHQLQLVLDSARVASSKADVEFTTDHPDQPTIAVSVLMLPAARGGIR